jgi:hypothetical protein
LIEIVGVSKDLLRFFETDAAERVRPQPAGSRADRSETAYV